MTHFVEKDVAVEFFLFWGEGWGLSSTSEVLFSFIILETRRTPLQLILLKPSNSHQNYLGG